MIVDLRSDTLTKPTSYMLHAMFNAPVGDDVWGEDPSMNELEEKTATLFGHEAAMFCTSGTMSNQLAIKVHTVPGDEVICDRLSHIYNYEGGGIALNSGSSVRLLFGDRGRFIAKDVIENINPDDVHYPRTRLVSVENTVNKGGGSVWNWTELQAIGKVCKENDLRYHLDGARLFNALAVTSQTTQDYGQLFDSISICLSKGLGAPVGSMLTGSKKFIHQARRFRRAFGGGMRQAGYLAAAGIYALDHHVERLKDDHRRAIQIAEALSKQPWVEEVLSVETNIIIFAVHDHRSVSNIMKALEEKGILTVQFGHKSIRMVTHLDIDDEMLEYATNVLDEILINTRV
ncbi:MAG: GntG family PLP-dependent aldolase [Bacteroidales bacterium]|nr:GntG family PLP-dependent aldolase [Bacteroidales bacterium]MDZ4205293.1 GntG family PLP-dependent aldolase [Bacteroidales bacterium]